MNGPTPHILTKDLRASWLSLLMLWVGVFITDALLTFPRIGPYIFFPQLVCWVYATYIFQQRMREDNTRELSTAWWVTRPLRAEAIVKAKELYAVLFLIIPPFLSRTILCRWAGYGWVDGMSTAWLGSMPCMMIVCALLARTLHYHDYKRHLTIWLTAVGGPPLILVTISAMVSLRAIKPPKLRHHDANPPALNEVGKMPDPDYIFDFPDDVILKSSSMHGNFTVGNHLYKLESQFSRGRLAAGTRLSPSAWFWYLRALPEHADLRAQTSVVNLPQETTIKKIIPEKGKDKRHELDITENGDGLRGKENDFAVYMQWYAVRIRQFWEGELSLGEKTAKDGMIFSLRDSGDGTIRLRIQTAVTHGIWPGSPALHAVGSGAAVVFASPEGDHDVLLTGPCYHVRYGFPGISQVYEFHLPDPRPFLTDSKHFRVSVYSAFRASSGWKNQRLNFKWEFPRMGRLKTLPARDMVLPDISTPGKMNDLNLSEKKKQTDQYDNPELAKKILESFWRYNSTSPGVWNSNKIQRNDFDPARKADISTVMALLDRVPPLYHWLSAEQRGEARKKLAEALRKRPVKNPFGMLAVAQEAGLATEEHADDLAWCFVHSYRQNRAKRNYDSRRAARRCDPSFLQVVPESARDRAWNETWDQFRVETTLVDYRSVPLSRSKSGYIMEAIRRKSPQAYATAAIYLRQIWAIEYGFYKQSSRDELLSKLLKNQKDFIPFLQDHCDGPKDPKAFLQWFLLNGFLLDK